MMSRSKRLWGSLRELAKDVTSSSAGYELCMAPAETMLIGRGGVSLLCHATRKKLVHQ
jgi:hypothetical protein